VKGLLRTLTLAVVGALAFGACVYVLARDGRARAIERLVGSYSTRTVDGGHWSQLELRPDGTFLHVRGETEGERALYSDEQRGRWRRESGALELIWSDGRVDSATVTAAGMAGKNLEVGLRGEVYRELVPLCGY